MSEEEAVRADDRADAPSHDLFAVIQTGDAEAVSALLETDSSRATAANEHGIVPLMWALYHRQQPIADLIAAVRKEINAPLTLHEAAAMGQYDVVREHLHMGDDLGSFSADGFTPLHFAAFFGRQEVVPLFLSSGAAVAAPAQNPSAVHPLHSAAAIGSVEICRLLLEGGAKVNAQQQGGFTALMSAALHGNVALVELLLEHEADVDIKSDDGKTALDMAREGDHSRVIEQLTPT